jgi:carbonic anhydrase
MDARLEATGFFERWPAPVHVIRNAGGRVTSDVLRSLAVSCTMEIDRIMVVHHTQCAMAERTENEIHQKLPDGANPDIELLVITDHTDALRRDVGAVRESSLIPLSIDVVGILYDLGARVAREIEVGPNALPAFSPSGPFL